MRYVVTAMLSIIATLAFAPIGIAQNGQDIQAAPSTPAARISQSHQDLAKGARAKTPATARNAVTNDNQPKNPDHIITFESIRRFHIVRVSTRAAGKMAVLFAPTTARQFDPRTAAKWKDRSRLNNGGRLKPLSQFRVSACNLSMASARSAISLHRTRHVATYGLYLRIGHSRRTLACLRLSRMRLTDQSW